jgi:chemotaxis protein MotB
MKKHKHPEHVNHERWLVSYADFITLLFAFFVVMFAVSQVDTKKVGQFKDSFAMAVGEHPKDTTLVAPIFDNPKPPEEGGGPGKKLPSQLEAVNTALTKGGEAPSSFTVLRKRNELVLRLADNVLFDSGDARVKPKALPVLEAILDEVKKHDLELRVEGHTDNVPISTARFRSNWELSTARATAVIEEIAKRGLMKPDRLSAAGYGEFRPIATNDTPEGRGQNRRVDLVIALPAAPEPAK